MDAMLIEPAQTSDAARVAELIRAGFEPAIVDATIYGCPGIADFIAEQIRVRDYSPWQYLVAREGDGIAGAAEFRTLGETLFLNYIAVDPAGRRRGTASALLAWAVDQAARKGLTTLGLDVFTTNARAVAWYERLGMTTTWERYMATAALTDEVRTSHPIVPDLVQAEALHARFGFSEVTVQVSGAAPQRVGRLGSRWFRVVGRAIADDAALRGALAALDPARSLLGILEPPAPAGSWRPLVVSRRMTGRFEDLAL